MNAIGCRQKIAVAVLTGCVIPESGLFKAIYEGTGYKCEPNHVAHLKETLSEVTRAMRISQHSVRIINGKVVYLFKIADQLILD